MGMMTTNMIGTKSAAYQAGLDGLPEPLIKTKHVREVNPLSGKTEEGDVETMASMRARQLWQRGQRHRELREMREAREAREAKESNNNELS